MADPLPAPGDTDSGAGDDGRDLGPGIVNADFAGTGALLALALAAAIAPETFGVPYALLSCLLFAVGTGAFLWAYALGVTRSREEVVTLPGLFFLAGSAPRRAAFRFRIVLAVQIVAVVAAASVRPFTELAFGILVPVFGLGLMALWGGRHGTFVLRET